jgi:hypothetical protein
VSKCYEQGFGARLDALRVNPIKIILHGVKVPQQFYDLHALFQEPSMVSCIGGLETLLTTSSSSSASSNALLETSKLVFSDAQQPPLMPLQGYKYTNHGKLHYDTIMSYGTGKLKGVIEWPVFEPKHCMGDEPMVTTEWESHIQQAKNSKFSPDAPSHVYFEN